MNHLLRGVGNAVATAIILASLTLLALLISENIVSVVDTIRRDVRCSEGIAEDVKPTLALLSKKATGGDLNALASATPERQRKAVAAVDGGDAQSIREVLNGEIVGRV